MGCHQILGLLCVLFCLHSFLPVASTLCPPDQRDALINFKNSFLLDSWSSRFCGKYYHVMSYPKTLSWIEGVDCCLWDGVTCDDVTGNIVSLDLTCSWLYGALHSNSSLFLLRHLRNLNLSGNDFDDSPIPPNLIIFENMTHLNLSRSHFHGDIPSEISHLSKLESLDLSFCPLNLSTNNFGGVVEFKIVANTEVKEAFPKLGVLDLSSCNFTEFPFFLNSMKRLTYLDLSYNRISGKIPKWFWDISHDTLKHLDLSQNLLEGDIPQLHWKLLSYINLRNNSLQGSLPIPSPSTSYFHADDNGFTGEIHSSICQLTSLLELDLSNNSLFGNIPPCFGNITNLVHLDLSSNNLQGPLPRSLVKCVNLSWLHLNHNELSDIFPHWLEAPNLQQLDLQSNKFHGGINITTFALSFPALVYLSVSDNNFSGQLPTDVFSNSSLGFIDLSINMFEGPIPLPPLVVVYYSVGSNRITGKIPSYFCNVTSIGIDLSYNELTGSLPQCFTNWSFFLSVLNLRRNHLEGTIPQLCPSVNMLRVLDLSQNQFEGRLPRSLVQCKYLEVLDLSHNRITGKIPSSLCNATMLEIINLSDNELTGRFPQCFTSLSPTVLNLRKNRLEGTIPISFASTNMLRTLDLSQNQFEGTLPRSLVQCEHLEVLDVSDNRMKDTFPTWLGTLQKLKVLVLRSNHFKGLLNIPSGAHLFPSLHILDLSDNNFGGPLPTNLFMNLTAMTNGENGKEKPLYMTMKAWYEDSVTVVMKGQGIRLVRILTIFTTVDLSCNSFEGDIPGAIGLLHSLIGLNLSHNHLIGSIPLTLGNLTDLEWLDLSSNKISGAIPRKLGDLTFLGYLNLSENRLIGRIPQDKQLSTFSSNSFGGNPGLCGTPLPKACPGDTPPPQPSPPSTFNQEGHESWFKQEAMWIGYASGIVIGISISYIAFELGRPIWLARGVMMLERRATKWTKKPRRKAIKSRGK